MSLVVIGKFIGQPGKHIASRAHLLVHFIKNRCKTALTPDFKTKLIPARALFVETGHKLFKGHEKQTVLLRTSLEAMTTTNLMPNEIRIGIA